MRTALKARAAAIVLAAALPFLAGCTEDARRIHAEPTEEHGRGEAVERMDHGGDHGQEAADVHEHGETAGAALTTEEIRAARCEHDMPTYQCAECRYEVGVVKVDDSLLKGQSPDGILELVQASSRTAASTILVTGEIRLNENRTVHLTPRIPGVVHAVHADIGSRVQEGELLFEISSVELGEALGEYEKNQSLAAIAQRNYSRERDLWAKKIGAEIDMLEAQARLNETQAALRSAEQRLHVLGLTDDDLAALIPDRHGRLRGRFPLRAPQAGTVLFRHASVGEAVEAERELMVLSDLSTVWAWLDVFDRDLERLLEAQRAGRVPLDLRVRAFPDKVFTGTLDPVGPIMEEETRTVRARAIIDNPDGLLRPGMFCEAQLLIEGDREIVAVPRDAVMSDEGVDFVFVPFEEGFFRRLDVRKGKEDSGVVEVLEGLAPGATIVGEGAFMLKSDVLRSKMGAGCAD